jgi:hypothetical protein
MKKTILLALAAAAGSVSGLFVFLVIDSLFHLLYAVDEVGLWTEYGSFALGGIGTICGVAMGWVAFPWINKPRMYLPAPSEIAPADGTVPSRGNGRPLKWLYRG